MKKLLALVFALMLLFSVALADEPLTIAVSMRSTASEYHMQYVAGAELFAATLPEGTAVVQALPCEGNDDKQINDINALIAAKGDNMILFMNCSTPTAGEGYEMNAIAASVLGGASLSGGFGSIPGTLLGTLLIILIDNVGIQFGIDPFIMEVVTGVVIVIAVVVDQLKKRTAAR